MRFPRVYRDVSGKRVLVAEFFDGHHIDKATRELGYSGEKIAKNAVKIIAKPELRSDDEIVGRFQREAKAAGHLETRHIGEEVHPGESVEEKISLSERFGLWISFYPFSQDDYLAAVASWLASFGVAPAKSARETEARVREALQFALQRGSRSGRVAWQLAKGYAGAAGMRKKKGA